MIAKIISVGSEILSGDILDTNSKYLAEKMQDLGIDTEKIIAVNDEFDKIKNLVIVESADTDIILITGGLGPTEDDMTKEAVAAAIGKELISDDESFLRLKEYFKGNSFAIENNNKQVIFPKGSNILPNKCGTADGFSIYHNSCRIIVMPGPPREMIPMFEDYIYRDLDSSDNFYFSKYYRISGMGEWRVEKTIEDLIHGKDSIATYSKREGLFIKIKIKANTEAQASKRFEEYEEILKNRFGDMYIGEGIKDPATILGELLEKKSITVSCAESITGGMIASKLIGYPGISKCLKESYITYSDDIKSEVLGVNQNTLNEHTAVSEEVLNEMLEGLYQRSNADLVIASTGYAGPTGDDIGLVYIGAMYKSKKSLIEKRYSGDRNKIRERAAYDALLNAWRLVEES
ncbi:MAG: CinA family nicotinamide mononucleotide deamidase-related protein [Tissierellia bacterium]|nr:CinA family nicotinamide mononucleotide deamidase-related protein [Tissierellia bacterium]